MAQSEMRPRGPFRRKLRGDEDGQVLVEYLLMLVMSISLLVLIQTSFRKSVFSVWKKFAAETSAACPKGCLPDGRIR